MDLFCRQTLIIKDLHREEKGPITHNGVYFFAFDQVLERLGNIFAGVQKISKCGNEVRGEILINNLKTKNKWKFQLSGRNLRKREILKLIFKYNKLFDKTQ